MSYVSVFEILKIGIGPSSSHTLGPWRASQQFIQELRNRDLLHATDRIVVKLYGSLALTGKGHGTDIAVILGLHDADPETIPMDKVISYPKQVIETKTLQIGGEIEIAFDYDADIEFKSIEQLVYHPNGMSILAFSGENQICKSTYFSVGGGFVIKESEMNQVQDLTIDASVPFPIHSSEELLSHCKNNNVKISDVIRENEYSIQSPKEVSDRLQTIWQEMYRCAYRGCHTEGVLPGGLDVRRRAADHYSNLTSSMDYSYTNPEEWIQFLYDFQENDFQESLRWISCFAMAVNEENANFGRVVTAPTNGASGVIPAVLLYLYSFSNRNIGQKEIEDFLLTCGVIGGLYKNGATISAAMGGCQAEIGVSSSMAAVALVEALGGSPEQALMAGEIAMEHHLGLTCDPVKGLVQIPCIERNTMGAIKAITAANLALHSDPQYAKVSLDNIIKTMWETSQDMNQKYKETSLGGLATNISVIVPEC